MVRHPTFLPFVGFLLASVWPSVHFLGVNAAQFQWMGASGVLVVVALSAVLWLTGICLAVAPAVFSIRWSIPQAFSAGIIGIFLLFSHETISYFLIQTFSLSAILSSYIYVFVLAGSLFVTWRLSVYEPVRVALFMAVAFMMTFSVVKLGPIITLVMSTDAYQPRLKEHAPGRALANNNVYYVILDGYAGRSALKKYLNYDVNPFLQRMHALGYSSIDLARTNYMTTYVSLMAMLDMDYVVKADSPKYYNRLYFFPYRLQHGPSPRIVRNLSSAGYEFIHIGNPWAPCRPRAEVHCLSDRGRFESARYVANVFLGPTKLTGALELLSGRRSEPTDALKALSGALESLIRARRPFFAFVHNLAPHPGFVPADCPNGFNSEHGREKYQNAIECVNRSVEAVAKRIHALDPDAIVVFQADHGSDFGVDAKLPLSKWSEASIDERSSILNLVHVPAACQKWLRRDLSQLNTMRLVFGCLKRRPPDYLNEHTYISAYESNPDFGTVLEVTHRLPEQRNDGMASRGR